VTASRCCGTAKRRNGGTAGRPAASARASEPPRQRRPDPTATGELALGSAANRQFSLNKTIGVFHELLSFASLDVTTL
jgi:hypothetical protein